MIAVQRMVAAKWSLKASRVDAGIQILDETSVRPRTWSPIWFGRLGGERRSRKPAAGRRGYGVRRARGRRVRDRLRGWLTDLGIASGGRSRD